MGSEGDRDAGRGSAEIDPGLAVAGDGVVARQSLEAVEVGIDQRTIAEGAGRVAAGKAGRDIGVVEQAAANGFDAEERVGADEGRIADHRAGREIYRDA